MRRYRQRQIIFEGNSLMNTGIPVPPSLVSNGFYVPTSLYNSARSGRVLSYRCHALNGRTQTEINASISTNIIGKTFPNDIIVLWEGTNDMFVNGLSGAAAYANLVTYRNAVMPLGVKLVVGTVAARDWSTDDADLMTRIDAYNALVRSNSALFSSVADIAASTLFDTKADASNTTYYLTDKLHLTQAGCDAVIAIISPAITAVL